MRQWRDVDAAREFRAFIHNKRLTACSQYCYYQCFPELVTGRDELAARIRDFFVPAFLDASPFESVIVDLHVSDRGVEVIELSPFDNTVGACMFSWKAPADRTVLESGPFELRILEEPKANPYECLPSKWRGYVVQASVASLFLFLDVLSPGGSSRSVGSRSAPTRPSPSPLPLRPPRFPWPHSPSPPFRLVIPHPRRSFSAAWAKQTARRRMPRRRTARRRAGSARSEPQST